MNGALDLPVLFEDNRLLVLDKPSGLLSVPGRGEQLKDSLAHRVQARFPDARVVHRLDRDTSGVLVMALDLAAQQALSRQFEMRTVAKVYEAMVEGQMSADAGRIELPLAKDMTQQLPPRHRVDHQHGRPAVTEYRVLARNADSTRLELRPETGRSHQLRVHLAAVGHPILGDPIYGPTVPEIAGVRLMLHALSLAVDHPATGQRMTWTAPCPF